MLLLLCKILDKKEYKLLEYYKMNNAKKVNA